MSVTHQANLKERIVPNVPVRLEWCKIGAKRNNWTVIGDPVSQYYAHGRSHVWKVPCRCECGKEWLVAAATLTRRTTRSCGSCNYRFTKHGGNGTKLYGVWRSMLARCYDETHLAHKNYGGRGVSMCDAWLTDFANFREWAERSGYAVGLEIDRFPNNNGNYEPDNCRWVTHQQNCRNMRKTVWITAFGETKCLPDWIEDSRCAIKASGIKYRLKTGWTAELAITTPDRRKRK